MSDLLEIRELTQLFVYWGILVYYVYSREVLSLCP
jgi:hypothetical protein